MESTQKLLDQLEELLIEATESHHTKRGPGQKRLAHIHTLAFELHQRVEEGRANTIKRRSHIWDPVPETQAGFKYGREDYQFLPDLNTRRLYRGGSYAGRGPRVYS